ncbi:hypothetical protein MILUP08_43487 [Micromonospora lupini str. Lupac 08]|uniref:Uncharacterized protein n=1 Tax=Micromonospora lupini str. Lupac 08 TaxID=1150864 RepID=I0L431_9ACTN|nr:hypothetical protein MILUP08_43487 [Micromonospora lupini str. Lupac 08]
MHGVPGATAGAAGLRRVVRLVRRAVGRRRRIAGDADGFRQAAGRSDVEGSRCVAGGSDAYRSRGVAGGDQGAGGRSRAADG